METYKTNLYLLDGKHMGKFYVAAESFEDAIKIGHHYLEKAYKNGWPELRVVSKYEGYVVGEEKKWFVSAFNVLGFLNRNMKLGILLENNDVLIVEVLKFVSPWI